VAEEDLRPGDVVVLYTDGVVGARDRQCVPFGRSGLAEVLEQEAPGRLLPEAARRVIEAVRVHRDDDLADDATILLLCPCGDERSSRWF
jgi:serine phosphatase RsbU (regulator of sigma subunit)